MKIPKVNYGKRKESHETNGNHTSSTDANVESDTGNAPVAANADQTFTSPVRISFHHIRTRLADIDGLSGKAAIDGLVEAGILATDSPKQVAEVRHSQSKGAEEETVIVIEEIETLTTP